MARSAMEFWTERDRLAAERRTEREWRREQLRKQKERFRASERRRWKRAQWWSRNELVVVAGAAALVLVPVLAVVGAMGVL